MSETGESQVPKSSIKAALKHVVDRQRIVANIVTKRDYDTYVDPNDYEKRVRGRGREKLAEDIAKTLLAYLPPHAEGTNPKVLDLAAGTGIISKALQDKGLEVVAADMSTRALQFLQETVPGVSTQVVDMNAPLPFEDNSFDGATSVWGNRFIKDPPALLSEIQRVLKPDGVFVWPVFPTEYPLWKKMSGIRTHAWVNSLRGDAQKAGFTVIGTESFLSKHRQEHTLPLNQTPSYIILRK